MFADCKNESQYVIIVDRSCKYGKGEIEKEERVLARMSRTLSSSFTGEGLINNVVIGFGISWIYTIHWINKLYLKSAKA